jgi:macrolide transport system ATP-binding/permease protein
MRPQRWIHTLPLRLRSLFRRHATDQELEEELRYHLEQKTQQSIAQGVPPQEARRAALLEMGGLEKCKEECRDARRVTWLQDLAQDIHFGLRILRNSPGVTVVIVVAIALGVGANTAIFSVVNGFLLRPLPVLSPSQITVLAIQQKDAPVGSSGFSYPEFVDFRQQASTAADIFGIVLGTVQFTANDQSEECSANYASGNFFTALGLQPAAGRLFVPSEAETPGQPLLVVLGYGYWQKRFGGDPRAIGSQILVNGKPATIIGVVPREFQGMYSIFETHVYLPMSAMIAEESASLFWENRDRRRILAFGRLKPGISLREAQSSLDVITARLARQYPATDKWFIVRAIPEKSARPIPYANNFFVAVSVVFLVLAALVLLLACMNVENILLARGWARQREMAIRAALGAGRARLIRQMLTESVLLAILGGGAGMLLGMWASRWTSSIHLQNLPFHVNASFDWRVFAFSFASALLTGLVVGILPALRASSADVNSVLHEGGRRDSFGIHQSGFRNFLVVAQVAGSFTLLVVAGLFVRSLQKARSFDLGFDPSHVLNVVMDPHQAGYDQSRTTTFYREIESRVRALPGVQSASLASYVPMGGFPNSRQVSLEGHPTPPGRQAPSVLSNSVDPLYFETMRITLLRGRVFTDSDNETAPRFAIINQTMAGRFWPRQDPIGKRFSMEGDTGPFMEVVGVTANGKYKTVGEDAEPFFFVPLAQNFASKLALQIRTLGSPESLAAPVQEQIARLAPDLAIADIETMNQLLAGAFGFFAFHLAASFAAALGVIGLILAVVGVYGVVSYAASQRTREIGIRMALGASSGDILHLVWLQGVRLVIVGIAVGSAAAWALTRAMTHMLAEISTSDPATYITVGVLLAAVALCACYVPARRAMRVDPMFALRYE